MKQLQLAALATALVVVASVAPSFAAATFRGATSATNASVAAEAAGTGDQTPNEVPILFDDHHVDVTPSLLQQGRVLGAIVYRGALLVPLRGMFEQMGATVSYDAASRSVTAHKEGADVRLTLRKNEAIINGEPRPLDVAPMMYRGRLMVPVRVISEALGAYVQWVPDQHMVVVRYVPATPVPTPAPTAVPTPVEVATPAPPPVPAASRLRGYAQIAAPFGRVYNEFATNSFDKLTNNTNGVAQTAGFPYSAVANGALIYKRLALKVDWRQDAYITNFNAPAQNGGRGTFFRTIDGGSAVATQFRARQSTIDGRLEWKLFEPNIYFGAAYLQADNSYGYPRLNAVGGGLEKLPSFDKPFGWYASGFYYPNANGTWHDVVAGSPHFGNSYWQSYNITTYDAGLTYTIPHTPVHFFGGYSGDQYNVRNANTPVNQSHFGPYAGLGVQF